MKNQKTAQQSLLQEFFTICQNGIRSGKATTPRRYCESLRLDYNLLNLGFISGQFHHSKDMEYKKRFLEVGLLKKSFAPVNEKGRVPFSCFGTNGLVFPMKDQQGNICNFFARRFKLDTPQDVYLYPDTGFFPNAPRKQVTTLYLTFGVVEAASLLQSELLEPHEGVLALFEGKLSKEQKEFIQESNTIEKVKFLVPNKNAKQIKKAVEQLQNKSITVIEHSKHSISDYLVKGKLVELESILNHETEISEEIEGTKDEIKTNTQEEVVDLNFVPTHQMDHSEEEGVTTSELNTDSNSLEHINSQKLLFKCISMRYEIVGKLPMDLSQLFVSIRMIHRGTGKVFRTKLDLYEIEDIRNRVEQLPLEFNREIVETDLMLLTEQLDQYRDAEVNRLEGVQSITGNIHSLSKSPNPLNEVTPMAQKNAIQFLQQPDLIQRIREFIEKAGIIGEEQSRTTAFVIASSYKMLFPMHGLITASSGKGKSHLINTIAELMPSEDVINLSRITSRSLYNYQKDQLMYKLLIIQDEDGLDEESLYALRELQTSGFLSSSTSSRTAFGKHQSKVTRVNAHFASLMATTKTEIYTDNQSRSIQIGLDESTEQTKRIIAYSNKRRAGLIDPKEQQNAKHLLRNCIRMLKREKVVNPFAHLIELPIEAKMLRRLNNQFQDFTAQITLLNQYQRERTESGAILTQKQDLIAAVDLFFSSIMFKVDELDSTTRQLYNELKEYLLTTSKGRKHEFTRREIRETLKLKKTKTFELFQHLQELEYIHVCKGSSNRGYYYQLDQWDEGLNKLKSKIKNHLEEQLNNIPNKQSA